MVLLKECTTHSLSRGLVIKLRSQMPIFLTVSVVEVTLLLSISVCWFWFRSSLTRKQNPGEMGLLLTVV